MFGFFRKRPHCEENAAMILYPPFLMVRDSLTKEMRLAWRETEPELYSGAYRETVRAFPDLAGHDRYDDHEGNA